MEVGIVKLICGGLVAGITLLFAAKLPKSTWVYLIPLVTFEDSMTIIVFVMIGSMSAFKKLESAAV